MAKEECESENLSRKNIEILRTKYKLSWKVITERINHFILVLNTTHVESKNYDKAWQYVFEKYGGKRYDGYWWNEMLNITIKILNEIENQDSKDTYIGKEELREKQIDFNIHSQLKSNRKIIENKVVYGIFMNQDSFIPKIYEATYKQKIPNIVFKPLKNWSGGLDALNSNEINVALLDFSTTIAYNCQINIESPLFFWPFFDFYGWYILIKKSSIVSFCQNNNIQNKEYKSFTPQEKKMFLEQQKIVVETRTDFEWIIKKYLQNNNCDPDIINNNIVDLNTNEGKIEFIKNKNYGIYCTNPLNVTDLISDTKYQNISIDIKHRNINGLICKEDYYAENKDIIHTLIKNWYYDINPLKNEISMLNKSIHFRDPDYTPSYTIQNLVRELVELTDTIVKIDNLPILYEHKTVFFESSNQAFQEFYEKILSDDKLINNYIEMTKLKLMTGNIDDNDILKVIMSIKNKMKNY